VTISAAAPGEDGGLGAWALVAIALGASAVLAAAAVRAARWSRWRGSAA
jgi:hypothetical protein